MATNKLGKYLAVCFTLAFAACAHAATYTWINASGGNWNVPANWSGGPANTVPGASDTAQITTPGTYTVTANGNESVNILVLGAASGVQTLAISDGTFTVNGTGTDNAQSELNLSGGTIIGPGSLTFGGPLTWTGGNIEAAIYCNGGSVNVSASWAVYGGALINSGTLAWTGNSGPRSGNGAVISNAVTGVINSTLNGNSLENYVYGGGTTFYNQGQINFSGAGQSGSFSSTFLNAGTGTVTINSGTLSLNGGGTDSDSGGGFNVAAGATLNVGNNYTFNAGSRIIGAGNFSVSGGTVDLAGALNAGGWWNFSGGTANLAGTTTVSGNAVTNNGNVNFNGTGFNGSGVWSPGVYALENGTLGGTTPVVDAGSLYWTGGQISCPFTCNGGSINVSASSAVLGGTLINTGTMDWTGNSGPRTGSGAVISNSASGIINSTLNGNSLDNYVYGGGSTFYNQGQINLSGAGQSGSVSSTFLNLGAGIVTINSGTFSVNGGGTDSDTTGGFNVLAGATLNIGNNYTFNASSLITGAGNFSVSGGTVALAGPLNAGGSWTFSGGTADLTGTTTTSGNVVTISGGTVNFNGTGVNGSGLWAPGMVNLSNGNLSGSAPVADSGSFNWTGGNIFAVVSCNGGSVNVSAGSQISAGALINTGTIDWTGNSGPRTGGGAVISNALSGIINSTLNGNSLDNYVYGGGSTFYNRGQINLSGAAQGFISSTFNNAGTGTVTVSSGTLSLVGGGTDSDSGGGFNIAAGATLDVGGNNTYTFNAGSLITGAGNFSLSSGTVTVAGPLNAGGSWTFGNGTANLNGTTTTSGNVLTISGGTVNFNGTGFNGSGAWAPGTLNLSNGILGGSTPVADSGSFNWTGGSIFGVVSCNGGSVNVSASSQISAGALINTGTIEWTGNSGPRTGGGAVISNAASGIINSTLNGNSLDNYVYGGGSTFYNRGHINLSGSGQSGNISSTFNNAGTGNVTVSSGTLSLIGGGTDSDSGGGFNIAAGAALNVAGNSTYTFNADSLITGAGDFSVSGGTATVGGSLNISGTWTFSGGTANLTGSSSVSASAINVSGGTVNFDGTGPWKTATMTVSSGGIGGATPMAVLSSGGFTWTGGGIGAATPGTGLVNINGGVMSGGGTLSLNGGQLVNGGALNWSATSLNYGNGSLISNTPAGTINLTGNLGEGNYGGPTSTFANSGQLNVTVSGTANINETFNNTGTVAVNGGTFTLNGGGTETGSFTTASGGTFNFPGATWNFSGNASIAGSGNFDISGATLNFTGSAYSVGGIVDLSGGTVNVDGSGTFAPTTLNLSGGLLQGSNPVSVSVAFNWTGGSVGNGPGTGDTVNFNGGTFSGGNTLSLNGGQLNNSGVLTWSATSFNYGNASLIHNAATGTINFTGNLSEGNYGGAASTFTNAGQINVTVPGTSSIGQIFNNTGTVAINGGTLQLAGGGTDSDSGGGFNIASGATLNLNSSYTFNAGSTISGAGNLTINSGTANFNGAVTASGTYTINSTGNFSGTGSATPSSIILNGTVTGTMPIVDSGPLSWNGTIQGALIYCVGGIVNNPNGINGGQLINSGTLTWIPYPFTGNGSIISNAVNGIINVMVNGRPVTGVGFGIPATFYNAGVMNFAGSGQDTIGDLFINTGTVNISSGAFGIGGGGTNLGTIAVASGATLNLTGGTFTNTAGGIISGDGNLAVSAGTANLGGTLNLGGTWSFTGGTANLTATSSASGYTLNVSGDVNFAGPGNGGVWTPGAVNISGGTLAGTDAIKASGALNWSAGNITAVLYVNGGIVNNPGGLDGGQLINSGTLAWIPYPFTGNGSVISNASSGILNVNSGGRQMTGNAYGGAAPFYNAGVMNIFGDGDATTTLGDAFFNTGTLTVSNGTFALTGSHDLTGGTLNFGINSPTSYGQISMTGPVVLTGTLSATLTNGYIPPIGSSWQVLTFGTATGSFTNTNLPPVAVWRTTYNPGNVTISVQSYVPATVWATPAPIAYGTPLSATQLDANSTIAGNFTYNPPAGTILQSGNQTLSATFTPSDLVNYSPSTVTTTITVQKTPLTVTANDRTKTYGQTVTFAGTEFTTSTLIGSDTVTSVALNSAGAASSATVNGSPYSIVPSAAVGSGATNYNITYVNGHLTVNKATPTITWANPAYILYPTPLTGVQLDATASVAGTFAYTPAAGTVLPAGLGQTLATTFTPTDSTDYTTANGTVTINVLSCYSAPSGLTDWWRANGNTLDAIGGDNGTIHGGVTYVAGEVGQAFSFDGATGYVDIPNAAALNPTGPFTVEFWENANPSQASSQSLLVDKSHGFADNTGWLFQTQPGTGQLAFGFGNGSGFPVATSTSTILDNQWHHIAGVWTGTEIDIYVDGNLQGSVPQTTAPANNTRDMEIGSSWGGGTRTRFFNGLVDEVSFYSRALSQNEIQGIFTAGTAGKCPPAVAVTWPNPTDVSYGTVLGSSQLNASANAAGTFAYTPAAGTILPAGNSQTLSVTFTPADSADFAPVTQTASINVQKLPLSITANNATKIYGQTAGLPSTAFVASGLINGDTVTGVTLTSSGAAATASVAGSPYGIVPSAATGTGVNNYNISYVNGSLTVSPAALTLTANNANKVYHQSVTFAGTEFQSAGLQNGDTIASVTLTSAGAGPAAPINGSPYPIVISAATGANFSAANYNITYINGQLFVASVPLTITANNASKNYGQALSFAGTEFTATGLLGGDTVASVTLTSDGAGAASSAGTHGIVPSLAVGTGLANYAITYANGTLTVHPAALTITANNLVKTYGQTESFSGTEFTSAGLLNSDSIATVRLNSTGASAGAGIATYPLVPSSAFGSGLNNYTISYVNGTLTVNPAALTVTANNLTMTQGGTVPTLTVSYSGFANGDGPSSLNGSPSLSTTATSSSALGTYPISVMLGTINDPNYTYSFVDGTLTVQQTTLYITANDATMTYGGTLPALSVSYSGFINGDTSASLTALPSVTTTGSSTSHAGTWPITASGAVDPNYTIVYVPGTLTINPAPLTITANGAGKTYGQAKGFAGTEFTAAPLLNGDTIGSVTLTSAGASASAGAGTYPIVPSAATGPRAGNYNITYDSGTLTVNPASLVIAAQNETKYFGQTFNFLGTEFTTAGLQNGDTVGSVTLTSPGAVSTASVAGSPYLITPSAATGGTFLPANYNITYVHASLNVLPVGNVPAITAVLPSAGPVAGGAAVTIIGSGFETGATVFFGAVPATGVQVQNNATIALATPPAPSGVVSVTVNNPDGNSVTLPGAYSYGNPPVISSSPTSLSLNQGQTAQFQVAASGDPTLNYQWQYNGANLLETSHTVGTHSTMLTVNTVTAADIGNYRCVVSNPYESVPSAAASLNVIVPPTTITVSPPSASVGPGGSIALTASANGTSPSFTWYQGNTLLAGQNSPTLNIANVQAGATYTAVAQNVAGSVTSAPVVISVLTYCANVQAAQTTYPEGTQFIPLTVQTLNCGNNSVMPNSGAVVWIYTLGTTRALPVTTDGSGNGTVQFAPLPVETGLVQFAVALPGQSAPPPTGSFTIIGMNLSQQSESPQLIVGVPQTNTLLLNNLTGVPLTGLRATILSAPPNVNITVSVPDSVPGNGAVQTTYTIETTSTSPSSATFAIQYTSTEGASVILPFSATMSPLTAQLSVIPGTLVGTMIEGSQTLVPFIVTNSGGAPSGPVQINIPSTPWLSVVTAQPIASLAPNQSAQVLLALQPTNGQPLGVYPGTIAIQGTNTSFTLPFSFTAVSTLVGNLEVTVQDELSVFGAGSPNLEGATVTVNDFLTGATVGTQVTDASGVVTFTGLTSAYYTVNVQSANHGSFSTTLLVAANTTTPLTAFLALQLVNYTWTVTPTVIPDTYDFTLTTVFVTEVPWPVITVSPGSIDLCGIVGDSIQVNLVITNSGLIAAEGLQLAVDNSNPDWSIVPLSTNLGNLEAESSMVVPVTLTRRGASSDASVPSTIAASVNWFVAALNRTEYNSTPIFIYNANPINCNPAVGSSTPVVPAGSGGTNGTGGFTGQAGYGNSTGGSAIIPVISQPSYNFPPPASGAVVAVTLQIDQSAVISQNAFHATLNLNNNAGSQVTDLQVQINPVDAHGNPAGSQFFIQPPLLTGINAVDGTGTLAIGANAQANWTIIPTTTAAANGTTNYAIGGTLSYNLNGQPVSIPLFAVPITVLPDPKLDLDYFLQHDVYSQDPFTTVVEPPQPFALGLRVRNDGLGAANNFTITSAEPTIINNANGLLINFQLLNSEIGTNNNPVPSFTLNMGNINPGTNVVGIWFMTASLEGDFTNFQASFQHSDALGGTETSVINSVRIHEMNHVVRITCPDDDLIPDFLCNDTTNVDALPDDVYSSDGNVYPVTSLTGAVAASAVTSANPVTTIDDTADIIPGGFVYFELPDPSDGLTITSVIRSDGKQLLIGPNVWQTPIRPHMVPPHLTNLVHIFDCDSTGHYTINYGAPAALSWPPPAPITYGTPLGSTQLDATATIPGTYNYNPPAGTILTPGTHTLSLTFTPTDTGAFSIINSNVSITVLPAPLTIAANNNLTKVYGQTETFAGTEFTATGLVNGDTVTSVTLTSSGAPATAPVLSSPYYAVVPSVAVGTGLDNYTITYANGTLAVTPAPLTVTAVSTSRLFGAPNPAFTATIGGLVNGDPATVVSGTAGFSTPATPASPVGPYNIIPTIGTLTAANYQFGPFVNGTLSVTPATPLLTWANPAPVSIGVPLGPTQLDATANVPGTFVYTPSAGTILPGGNGQLLSTVFTPTDSTDYTTASATVHIDVSGCDTAPSGLVSWWKGDGNTFDVVGGNSGTLENGVAYVAGEVGQAFNFDANSAMMVVGNPANLQLQDFTIEAWVRRASSTSVTSDSSASSATLFGYGSGGYAFGLTAGGALSLGKVDDSSVVSTASITDTSFHHVAVTKSGTTVVFYVDGTAVPASTFSASFQFTTPAAIGGRADDLNANGNTSFLGAIDEIAVYNRALTSAEVNGIYDAGTGGKCLPTATVTWTNPSDITYGAPLTSVQLDASANVAGSFVYTPPAGTILPAGGAQTLSVTFTPSDTADYPNPVVQTAMINVQTAALSIAANNNFTKVYGQTKTFAGTEFTTSGLVNGDSVTSVTLTSAGAPAPALVAGSPYPVVPSGAVGTGLSNYAISYVNGSLVVTTAPLTVAANDASRAFGDPNPTFTGSITGLQNSDNITATYSTVATPTSPAGNYLILPHLLDPDGKLANYDTTTNIGRLTITAGFISLVCQPDITVNYNSTLCGQVVPFNPVAMGDPTPTLTCTLNGVPITSPYLFPVGTNTVMVTATSSAGTDNCSFRVVVVDTNLPFAGPNTLGTYENTSTVEQTAKILLRDSSPLHLPLNIISVTSPTPAGATVSLANGQVHYMPATSFIGLDTLTYTLSDGCGTAPGTVLVTVLATNLPTQNLESISVSVTGRTVVFHGIPNANYQIEWAPAPNGPWTTLSSTITAAANGLVQYTDTTSPVPTVRFYRTKYISGP